MYKPNYTNQFKKQYKLIKKRGLKISLLDDIMKELAKGNKLPPKNHDHELTGNYVGYRECHVQPNWLLIYYILDNIITFDATGSHSDLF